MCLFYCMPACATLLLPVITPVRNCRHRFDTYHSSGAVCNARDPGGTTPLFCAAMAGHAEAAAVILGSGAAVDAPAGDLSLTPLQVCVSTQPVGCLGTTRLLLAARADARAIGGGGKSAVGLAEERLRQGGSAEAVLCLLRTSCVRGFFFFFFFLCVCVWGQRRGSKFFMHIFPYFFYCMFFLYFRAGLGHFFSTRKAQFRSFTAASQPSLSFPPPILRLLTQGFRAYDHEPLFQRWGALTPFHSHKSAPYFERQSGSLPKDPRCSKRQVRAVAKDVFVTFGS